ncbi:acyltransferase domain-containing protein [Steroidobacter sp. S1-65]|uniref:Acyltransferase domain-containing protein n=1 Tax=Steroidobacter gossypii TaxID=2805490 RepID=A0ABS1X5S5_9GAMM|nr:acyltransferase domain-containing protein [Steroidobacter gossypii]MBM0108586.1 acyltransferase domain-containing protein [Steroidobacter gossypii]
MPHAPTVFMFSGQGSHYFQMGRELYERNEIFRRCMARLDAIACAMAGQSVIETIYSPRHKSETFDRTLLTHPAIFMVEYSLAQSLMAAGVKPDLTLGASLGTFAAATIAGWLSVEDAMAAVLKQAIAFETCCEPGGIIAVLADPTLMDERVFREHCELAGINFASHFAVSMAQAAVPVIEAHLSHRQIVFQRLPVSFAFHSRWIEEAQAPFESFMRSSVRCTRGPLPLVCCELGRPLESASELSFWRVVRHPIRFREAIACLEQRGMHRYIDVGPAGTLAMFLKYQLTAATQSTVHAILTPLGQDQKNFARLLSDVGVESPH